MCDFEKQGFHLTITINTGFFVEFVKKCIYCCLSNTVVYVKDNIIQYNWTAIALPVHDVKWQLRNFDKYIYINL